MDGVNSARGYITDTSNNKVGNSGGQWIKKLLKSMLPSKTEDTTLAQRKVENKTPYDSPMYKAAEAGNLDAVIKLIQQGEKIKSDKVDSNNALRVALFMANPNLDFFSKSTPDQQKNCNKVVLFLLLSGLKKNNHQKSSADLAKLMKAAAVDETHSTIDNRLAKIGFDHEWLPEIKYLISVLGEEANEVLEKSGNFQPTVTE